MKVVNQTKSNALPNHGQEQVKNATQPADSVEQQFSQHRPIAPELEKASMATLLIEQRLEYSNKTSSNASESFQKRTTNYRRDTIK